MIINKQTLTLKIMNKLTKTNTPKNCTEMYLEYVNDWLTIESMAEYHNLEIKDLERIIEIGKKEHNTKSNTPLKIMKTFKDLKFNQNNPNDLEDVHAIIEFDNGYGASVLSTSFSYGGKNGLYELAVLKDGDLCYTTPITNNVLGWLKEEDINRILTDIQNL
jgi:hypothetical protein